jgi:hypothetical protein
VVSNAFDICTSEANLIQTHGTLQAQLKRAQKNKGSHAASYLTSEFGRVQLLHRSRIPIPEDTCLKYDDAPNMQSALSNLPPSGRCNVAGRRNERARGNRAHQMHAALFAVVVQYRGRGSC